ncbi:MAG: tRNA uridine-5-carboxymethylaminomethyl(34) synthesis GTPase MnmE [Alphaproteobacteria bacterium]
MKTIYALASAHGTAGVSIIRISGNKSSQIAKAITHKANFEPRYAYFAEIHSEDEIIDSAIVIYFKAPNSFTGEDSVEIQCHGSRAVLQKIYELLETFDDVRPAKRGEFTERAVENNKLDLVQAEGLLDLVHAKTEAQRKQAIAIKTGKLSHVYTNWRKKLLELLTLIEADIDFSEEPLPLEIEKQITEKTSWLIDAIATNLENPKGTLIRDGISIAIIGKPNAGKSTLFNFLVGKNASIISSIPGTTRDIVEATIDIKGYEICFADTAGLRETADTIEKEGVRRALEKAENADIKILVSTNENSKIDEKTILVLNKSDEKKYKNSENAFVISAKNGNGIPALSDEIEKKILDLVAGKEEIGYANARHFHYLKKAKNDLEKSLSATQTDLKAEHILYASNFLGELLGEIKTEEILKNIFSNFCIGK